MKQACSNPANATTHASQGVQASVITRQEITWMPPETIPGDVLVSLRTHDGGRLLLLATDARIHRHPGGANATKDGKDGKDATNGPAIALLYADAVVFKLSPCDETEAEAMEESSGRPIPLLDPAPCDECDGRTVATFWHENRHSVTIRCTRCGCENVMQDVFHEGSHEYWGCMY